MWKQKLNYFIIGSLLVLTTNCGEPVSDLRIGNGTVIEESEWPAVVELYSTPVNGRASACTGTFVGPNTLLTAAHCVRGGAVNYGEHVPKHSISNRDYGGNVDHHDLAVVIYEEDVAPAVMPISTREPVEPEEFTMVGYGNNLQRITANGSLGGVTGSGIKRKGKSSTYLWVRDDIQVYGDLARGDAAPGSDLIPITMTGDSGGPFIIKGTLAGTLSGGGPYPVDNRMRERSIYTNINSASSKRFLKAILDDPEDRGLNAKITYKDPDSGSPDDSGNTDPGTPDDDTDSILAKGEKMNIFMKLASGSNYALKMSVVKSEAVAKITLCFGSEQQCAQDILKTTKEVFSADLNKETPIGERDVFGVPAIKLDASSEYNITAIAFDKDGKVVNSRAFNLSK